jgi:hypothetical protein
MPVSGYILMTSSESSFTRVPIMRRHTSSEPWRKHNVASPLVAHPRGAF